MRTWTQTVEALTLKEDRGFFSREICRARFLRESAISPTGFQPSVYHEERSETRVSSYYCTVFNLNALCQWMGYNRRKFH